MNGQNVQVYLDLDGVLVNFNKGFKQLSGGVSAESYAKVKFNGDAKAAKRAFWAAIGKAGAKWWENLETMPDGMVLWGFFKRYNPIILTAGQGRGVREGKTAWVRKHLGQDVKMVLADKGENKPNYVTQDPNTTHFLIDDMQKNIDKWNLPEARRVAILHTSAGDSIRQFKEMFITNSDKHADV